MPLELYDLAFHFLCGLVNLRQLNSPFFEVEGILVQEVELLGCHVPVAVPFARVKGAELSQSITQLRPFLLQFLNFSLQLPTLGLVVLKFLLFSNFNFLEVEAEVFRDSMKLPQDFILGKDVLEVATGAVVFFS